MHIEKKAYDLDEFCEAHSVGKSKVYEEVAAGRLRVRKFGKKNLITAPDAEAWLNSLPVLEAPTSSAAA